MIKYNNLRNQIQNGDIVLYHGHSIISKSIEYFDNAYFSHAGIVWKVGYKNNYRLLTLEMFKNGMTLNPLSKTMDSYGHDDFCIIRPILTNSSSADTISDVLQIELNEWEGGIGYDFKLILAIAIYKKTGLNLKFRGKNQLICSELAQQYSNNLGLTSFIDKLDFTPQDVIRFAKPEEFKILFNDEK